MSKAYVLLPKIAQALRRSIVLRKPARLAIAHQLHQTKPDSRKCLFLTCASQFKIHCISISVFSCAGKNADSVSSCVVHVLPSEPTYTRSPGLHIHFKIGRRECGKELLPNLHLLLIIPSTICSYLFSSTSTSLPTYRRVVL